MRNNIDAVSLVASLMEGLSSLTTNEISIGLWRLKVRWNHPGVIGSSDKGSEKSITATDSAPFVDSTFSRGRSDDPQALITLVQSTNTKSLTNDWNPASKQCMTVSPNYVKFSADGIPTHQHLLIKWDQLINDGPVESDDYQQRVCGSVRSSASAIASSKTPFNRRRTPTYSGLWKRFCSSPGSSVRL